MLCRINDFKYKDVVNAGDGVRLGYVGDVELDTESAALTAIVIRGRYRLFGLLGREEDTVIPWEDIQVIGEDTILVRCPAIKKSARRRRAQKTAVLSRSAAGQQGAQGAHPGQEHQQQPAQHAAGGQLPQGG